MSPWDEGFKARQRGEEATSNPYKPMTEKWLEWADGWKDLDEHFRDRDEALRSIGWYYRLVLTIRRETQTSQ